MKKLMILAFIASASLHAETINLDKTVVKTHGLYSGSITQNENKNIVLITKDDIQKKEYKNVIDIFKDSPVTMVTYTQAGPLVALRGSGEKTIMRVNVLLNGMPINTMDEAMGVIPFNAIPVNSIEKVEIIPGGGVTLYGSGSSSGIINIITNKADKNAYGNFSYTYSRYDKNNLQLSKGIRINDKLFVELGGEFAKGHAYREGEKNKKYNFLGGLDFKLNERHKFNFLGTKYHAHDEGTDELTYNQLKLNRRGAGNSDYTTKSNRKATTFGYEYTPNENFDFTVKYNQSKFTRDVKQRNRPFMNFLPSAGFNSFFGMPDGMQGDLVLINVYNHLNGKFEEKQKSLKTKGNLHYNRGNFVFGYDHDEHSVYRDMHVMTDKFNPWQDTRYYLRPFWESTMDEATINTKQKQKKYIFDTSNVWISFGLSQVVPEIDDGKLVSTVHNFCVAAAKDVYKMMDNAIKDPRKNRLLKENLRDNDYEDYISNVKALKEGLEQEAKNPGSFKIEEDYYLSKTVFWAVIDDIVDMPVKDLVKDGTTEINSKIENDNNETVIIKTKLLPTTTLRDIQQNLIKQMGVRPDLVNQQAIVNAWVDVKKTTDSFYLYNDYKLTDNLIVDGGLRYEKASYKGHRYSEALQRVSIKPIIKDGKKDYEVGEKAAKDQIDFLGAVSDIFYSGEKSDGVNSDSKAGKKANEDLKKNHYADIPMVRLSANTDETIKNVGGHIGLTYKFNDTNSIYGKYERGFNSPLPTQFTNKTKDPFTKIKSYWESHIKAETTDNFELGVRGVYKDNYTFSLSGFLSNTHNEILSVVKNGSSHMLREWRFINLKKTRRMGIELQAEQYLDKLTLKQSFTYTSSKILSNDLKDSTDKIFNDTVNMALERHYDWMDRKLNYWILHTDDKDEYKGISQTDRIAIGKDISPLIKDTIYNTASSNEGMDNVATTNSAKVKNIIAKYEQKYANNSSAMTLLDEIKAKVTGGHYDYFNYKGWINQDKDYRNAIEKDYSDEFYSAIKGRFLQKGDEIPLTPKYKATFSADYQFTDKLSLGANMTYIGKFTHAEPVNGYGIKTINVPGHVVTDIYGTYNFTPDLSAKFTINNLFNSKYYLRQDSKTATPAPGITYSLGITYDF